MTVHELDVATCLDLLGTTNVGRLAVDDGRGPVVLPVDYVLDRGSVVFRTDLGTKLFAAEGRDRAAFEIDHVDAETRTAWSVLVRGKLVEIHDSSELERLRTLPLSPMADGDKGHYVRLSSWSISGRRVERSASISATSS